MADGKITIKEYLANKRALVIEEGDSCRHGIANTLVDLGLTKSNLIMLRDFKNADDVIATEKPEIIVCEYNIGDLYGLDLLEQQKKYRKNVWDHLFVLVTINGSESTVAEAAEEDVDSYILKPFSSTVLRQYLEEAVRRKMVPPDYVITIQDGKDLLEEKKFEEAYSRFTMAKLMDPKPSLACFYCGVTRELQGSMDKAIREYREGLNYNEIHYKCLIGEFEALESLGQKEEAYVVIQRLLKHFPVSPQRLGKIFSLAVHTRNFEDVDRYFDLYQKLGRKTDTLLKIVSAGLFVCGRFHLINERRADATQVFRKAILASSIDLALLENVVMNLIRAKYGKGAEEILKLYPQNNKSDDQYLKLDFMVCSAVRKPNEVIEQGKKVISKGLKDPDVFEILIQTLLRVKNFKLAESMAYQAFGLFPDMRARFRPLLDEAEAG